MDKFKKYKDYQTIMAVNSLIWCEGKVLLLKRALTKSLDPGKYSGIGGKVEPGEDFYSAMLREIKEEANLDKFESIRVFSITQHPYPPTKAEWINVYFSINLKEQVEIPESEDGKFEWIDPSQIDKLPTLEDLREYIKILVKNPDAFILGFYKFDDSGKLVSRSIRIS